MTGLEKIIDRISADAAQDARRILTETEAECRKIAEEYAAKGIATRDRVIEKAEKEGENIIARARSTVEMNRRNLLLAARAEVLNRAFEKAKAEIRDTDFGKYRELLSALLVCALIDVTNAEKESLALGDEVEEYDVAEVLFNPADREAYGRAVVNEARRTLEKRVGAERAAKLCLSDETASIDGGLILRCGNIETNCSLSMLIEEMRREMEGKVAAILFPEET